MATLLTPTIAYQLKGKGKFHLAKPFKDMSNYEIICTCDKFRKTKSCEHVQNIPKNNFPQQTVCNLLLSKNAVVISIESLKPEQLCTKCLGAMKAH